MKLNVFKLLILAVYLILIPISAASTKTDAHEEAVSVEETKSFAVINVENMILNVTEKCFYLEYEESSENLVTILNLWNYAPSKLNITGIESKQTTAMLATYTNLVCPDNGLQYTLTTYKQSYLSGSNERLSLSCVSESPLRIDCNAASFTIMD